MAAVALPLYRKLLQKLEVARRPGPRFHHIQQQWMPSSGSASRKSTR